MEIRASLHRALDWAIDAAIITGKVLAVLLVGLLIYKYGLVIAALYVLALGSLATAQFWRVFRQAPKTLTLRERGKVAWDGSWNSTTEEWK